MSFVTYVMTGQKIRLDRSKRSKPSAVQLVEVFKNQGFIDTYKLLIN
jgi:hypothetical protein